MKLILKLFLLIDRSFGSIFYYPLRGMCKLFRTNNFKIAQISLLIYLIISCSISFLIVDVFRFVLTFLVFYSVWGLVKIYQQQGILTHENTTLVLVGPISTIWVFFRSIITTLILLEVTSIAHVISSPLEIVVGSLMILGYLALPAALYFMIYKLPSAANNPTTNPI